MPRIRAATIDQHKALTRASLLDAARMLIDEAGTAEVPLGEISLAAGVGRTTFYDYFADRDDVIASLVEEHVPRVISEMIEDVDSDLALCERLARLVGAMVEFVATDRVFGVILHREVGKLGPDAQRRIRAAHSELSAEITRIHGDGVEQGLFTPMPEPLAGLLIQDTIMAGAKAAMAVGAGPGLGEVKRHVERFLLAGLGQTGLDS